MEKIDITIIGAGVIGLAIASELSRTYREIFIIEKNFSFGQETSSRNSEVIHAGIYYPAESLKTKTCIEGKEYLYEFARHHAINHKKIGKLVVALNAQEIQDLEALFKNGLRNGITDLQFLSKSDVKKMEPAIRAEAALFSPSTGILDTHRCMACLERDFKGRGGQVVYNTEVTGIEKVVGGFAVRTVDTIKEEITFFSRVVVNCAGLYSDKIARLAGIKKDDYRLKYCKGDYFRVAAGKSKYISRLIYPVPKIDRVGLGIHATLDVAGGLRLGPDDTYVEKIDYNVDASKRSQFYESTKNFLPFIEPEDIQPDTSGIRPKLQGPGGHFRDFVIQEESDAGRMGFINLIGIESPGFTSALSIAKLVIQMVDRIS